MKHPPAGQLTGGHIAYCFMELIMGVLLVAFSVNFDGVMGCSGSTLYKLMLAFGGLHLVIGGGMLGFHILINVNKYLKERDGAADTLPELDAEPPAALKKPNKLSAIGLSVYLEQAGLGDDEEVLERAAAWVDAQKPELVEEIIQFGLVDDFVNALDLPRIPKTKLLGALKPQVAGAVIPP